MCVQQKMDATPSTGLRTGLKVKPIMRDGEKQDLPMDKDKKYKKRRAIAGSIEPCVHNLGTERFVEWLEDLGLKYVAIKLGHRVAELVKKLFG